MSRGPTGRGDVAVDERVRRRFRLEPGAEEPARRLERLLREEDPLLPEAQLAERARRLAVDLVGLGSIEALLEDPDVTDVLVNGPGPIWVERAGRLERTAATVTAGEIDRAIERLVGPLGLRADRSHPIAQARLPDGTRVAVVLPPLAVDGPVVAVRRHRARRFDLAAFAGPAVRRELVAAVRRRANVVVFGPTGSGKTTLLGCLFAQVPGSERIITIEDVAELRIPGEHVVRLEARPGSAQGVGRTDIRELVKVALRLRPDRLVVGEVRGEEAIDMVWAMSTGHDGCMSTCHASSAHDALARLETMCVLGSGGSLPLPAVRQQVRRAVDLLVGVRRGPDGARRVVELAEVREDEPVEVRT